MHLVLYRKQFSHVNPKSIKRANVNVAREKGAVAQVRINTVTIVRKKFSEVFMEFFGHCTVQLISSVFNYICFLCADNVQQMEKANWWGVLLKRQD